MIDAVRDYLVPKRFGIVAYVCVIVHFLCGLAFTAVTAALRASENGKFSCSVDPKTAITYKKQVDQVCFARYDRAYNSPLPLYGFVLLSIGFTVLVSVIYSLIVSTGVDEIESSYERQTDGEDENHGQNRRTVYVFYCYFVHLVLRSFFGIVLTVLHHTYFYPNGFDLKFSCNLPTPQLTPNINTPKSASRYLNSTSVKCENSAALEKWLWNIIVSITNAFVALVVLGEVIYLCRRLPILNCRSGVDWSCDSQFVVAHFLRKRHIVTHELEVTLIENSSPKFCNQECSTLNNSNKDSTIQDSIHFYKQQVLNRFRAPDINYIQKTGIDDLYIDVVIHTERTQHEFSKEMKRQEIYDVYMDVPPTSIRLENIKDLFYPNEDTECNFPRSILAIGRPGIGKTVLTEKILRDWANGVDEYYCDKITFFFKFRWFNDNVNRLTNLSLKTFLQFGTKLNREKFESIYEEIAKEPEKAILIFDGLDEFHGNSYSCLDQSRMIPDDPNICMSAINFFSKLVLGDLLKGATVLVTSRPTEDDFYSRIDFDRSVEIIGFTSGRIEEYVSQFCDNNKRHDLKSKVWNHIKSSPELLNLCYIPGNCFVVCVTLSGCLSDSRNDTDALPTTLTELYQISVDHFEKYYHRNADGNPITAETLEKLQSLAFRGMENGELIFNQELFNEQMKGSGLLNSLSNPLFPIQTQFCFIHLTIQEFLAARHVVETLAPVEIKQFISDHVGSGKWHLVLQFIAGLLGKKIKMFDKEYKDCIFEFAESLEVTNREIEVNYHEVFIIKCLREMDDNKIAKDICETNAINDVEKMCTNLIHVSPSEWAAVTFICKHMKNLAILELNRMNADCLQQVLELLRKRCINQLTLNGFNAGSHNVEVENVFGALMDLNCTLNHEHNKLTSLTLECFCMTDAGLSNMRAFFKNGHARHLTTLNLSRNEISSFSISKLCEILNNEHCPELTYLCLRGNLMGDEGAQVLCDTLIKGLGKLHQLNLSECSLTDRCIPSLCKALQDKHCQLYLLSLWGNFIGNEGVGMLFEDAMTKEHCKLTELNLDTCSLTNRCIPSLCKALQDERCQLTVLLLGNNAIGDEGVSMLLEDGVANENAKLTQLNLDRCSLTDRCIPSLCKALQDESCKLTVVSMWSNAVGDEGVRMLFEDALTKEQCKLTTLGLRKCSLTDQCIPSLCKALQDEHCQLSFLWLGFNVIRDKGVGMLFEDALTKEHCKLTELDLNKCSLTDQCIPSLCKALQDERFKITKLWLRSNKFTENGKSLLHDVRNTKVVK